MNKLIVAAALAASTMAVSAADKKPAKPAEQCRALTTAGSRCTRKPKADCYYCEQHARLGKAAPAGKGTKPAGQAKK